jgi:hypothetical protein
MRRCNTARRDEEMHDLHNTSGDATANSKRRLESAWTRVCEITGPLRDACLYIDKDLQGGEVVCTDILDLHLTLSANMVPGTRCE